MDDPCFNFESLNDPKSFNTPTTSIFRLTPPPRQSNGYNHMSFQQPLMQTMNQPNFQSANSNYYSHDHFMSLIGSPIPRTNHITSLFQPAIDFRAFQSQYSDPTNQIQPQSLHDHPVSRPGDHLKDELRKHSSHYSTQSTNQSEDKPTNHSLNQSAKTVPSKSVNIISTSTPRDQSSEQPPRRKTACNFCHHSKVQCDGVRPCSRCIRMRRGPSCCDRQSRTRRHALEVEQSSDDSVDEQTTSKKRKRSSSHEGDHDNSTSSSEVSERALTIRQISRSPDSSRSVASSPTVAIGLPYPLPMQASHKELSHLDPTGEWLSLASVINVSPIAYISRLILIAQLRFQVRTGSRWRTLNEYVQYYGLIRAHDTFQPIDFTSRIHSAHVDNTTLTADEKRFTKLNHRSDDPVTQHCTGEVCRNRCPEARQFVSRYGFVLNFLSSPMIPSDDTDMNNFPCLTFKMQHPVELGPAKQVIKQMWSDNHKGQPAHAMGSFQYPTVIRVNRAFERVFGIEQSVMRAAFIRHWATATFTQLFARSEWPRLCDIELAGEVSGDGWQSVLLCRHGQSQSEFPAFVVKTFQKDDDDVCIGWKMSFIPLKHGLLTEH